MKNWAGNVSFTPKQTLAPQDVSELQDIVRAHAAKGKKIRVRGSGHSWTELIATQETFLHLDLYQGILKTDKSLKQITAKAGTKLHRLGQEAFEQGLALENQGDINLQSVAGAMSTGTHGTGVTLKSMANQMSSFRLINGQGDLVDIDKNKNEELYQAAGVSFGSLGLLSDITLQMVDAYKLEVETFPEDMATALKKFPERLKNNRHLEMFYFPVGDWAIIKTMNPTSGPESKTGFSKKFNDVVLENWLYELINIVAFKTKSYSALDKFMRKFVSPAQKVAWSHEAFPTQRSIRFMEMEYNLPLEKFEEVLNELKASIKQHQFQTLFPIEIRFVKGDSLWLSPAYGRDSVYFAIHTYIAEDCRPYFHAMESIFKRHGGRPHWGKWHNLTASDFEKVYPKWHDFLKVRQEFDPRGVWMNSHLRSVFYNSK